MKLSNMTIAARLNKSNVVQLLSIPYTYLPCENMPVQIICNVVYSKAIDIGTIESHGENSRHETTMNTIHCRV
jgi:hypothetical protein